MVNCRSKKTFVFMLSWIAGGSNLFGLSSDYVKGLLTTGPALAIEGCIFGYVLRGISRDNVQAVAIKLTGGIEPINYKRILSTPHVYFTPLEELIPQVLNTPNGDKAAKEIERLRCALDHPDSERKQAQLVFEEECRKQDKINYAAAMKIKAEDAARQAAHEQMMRERNAEIAKLERELAKQHRAKMKKWEKEEKDLLAQIDAQNKIKAENARKAKEEAAKLKKEQQERDKAEKARIEKEKKEAAEADRQNALVKAQQEQERRKKEERERIANEQKQGLGEKQVSAPEATPVVLKSE